MSITEHPNSAAAELEKLRAELERLAAHWEGAATALLLEAQTRGGIIGGGAGATELAASALRNLLARSAARLLSPAPTPPAAPESCTEAPGALPSSAERSAVGGFPDGRSEWMRWSRDESHRANRGHCSTWWTGLAFEVEPVPFCYPPGGELDPRRAHCFVYEPRSDLERAVHVLAVFPCSEAFEAGCDRADHFAELVPCLDYGTLRELETERARRIMAAYGQAGRREPMGDFGPVQLSSADETHRSVNTAQEPRRRRTAGARVSSRQSNPQKAERFQMDTHRNDTECPGTELNNRSGNPGNESAPESFVENECQTGATPSQNKPTPDGTRAGGPDFGAGEQGSPAVQWFHRTLPGGTKLQGGFLSVQPDGSLGVCVDDDYYNGGVGPAEALELARGILKAQGLPLYVVRRGDFPLRIAKHFGVVESRWRELLEANPQKERGAIHGVVSFRELVPGEALRLPLDWCETEPTGAAWRVWARDLCKRAGVAHEGDAATLRAVLAGEFGKLLEEVERLRPLRDALGKQSKEVVALESTRDALVDRVGDWTGWARAVCRGLEIANVDTAKPEALQVAISSELTKLSREVDADPWFTWGRETLRKFGKRYPEPELYDGPTLRHRISEEIDTFFRTEEAAGKSFQKLEDELEAAHGAVEALEALSCATAESVARARAIVADVDMYGALYGQPRSGNELAAIVTEWLAGKEVNDQSASYADKWKDLRLSWVAFQTALLRLSKSPELENPEARAVAGWLASELECGQGASHWLAFVQAVATEPDTADRVSFEVFEVRSPYGSVKRSRCLAKHGHAMLLHVDGTQLVGWWDGRAGSFVASPELEGWALLGPEVLT